MNPLLLLSCSSSIRAHSVSPANNRMLRLLFLFTLLLLRLLCCCFAGVDHDRDPHPASEDSVIVLDASNFTSVVKQHAFIVVEFYAPWCGHCKKLAPEYEKAAATLKENDPPVILAKIDATEEQNKGLATDFGVQGYPTLKIIENEGTSVRDYKGPRDADGMISYLRRQAGPPSEEITSLEQAQDLIHHKDIVIVGVFPSHDADYFQRFISIASTLRSDYDFWHTFDAAFLPSKDVVTGPIIRVFKKFDEGLNDSKEFEDWESVKKFLDEVTVPSILYFNDDPKQREYFAKIFMNPDCSKVFLFAEIDGEDTSNIKEEYKKLAKIHRSKGLRFVIAEGGNWKALLQYLGLKNDTLPSIFIQNAKEEKYLLENAEAEKIASWFDDYFDGKLLRFYKSQPVPVTNYEAVKVVVRDTFERMVLNSGKNVLLEFYAPWCGYCKSLAQTLEEVATEFESDAEVIIAKFDATANDIENKEFNVEGYPTVYLYSATGKLTFYNGDRSKEDLVNFINSNRDSIEQIVSRSDLKDEL